MGWIGKIHPLIVFNHHPFPFLFPLSLSRIKKNFQFFSLAGTGRAVPRRLDKPAPDAAALDAREQQFLDDFHALLSTAHFRVLTAKEWDTAQAENFTVREKKKREGEMGKKGGLIVFLLCFD